MNFKVGDIVCYFLVDRRPDSIGSIGVITAITKTFDYEVYWLTGPFVGVAAVDDPCCDDELRLL